MPKKQQFTPVEYLRSKAIEFHQKGDELQFRCPFNVDCDGAHGKGHMYMNSQDGLYYCQKCGEQGNLYQFAQKMGDAIGGRNVHRFKSKPKPETSKLLTDDDVDKYHEALPQEVRDWLRKERGISDEVINRRNIGYGSFYNNDWIIFPIKHEEGWQFKLRKDPRDDQNTMKSMNYPKGCKAALYGQEILVTEKDYVVICEGELDMLLLESLGVVAVTTTAGAGTFKSEWVKQFRGVGEVIVCYDNDQVGMEGAQKVLEMLSGELNDKALYQIKLPDEVGDHGDVTDYFLYLDKTLEDFMSLKKLYKRDDCQRVVELAPPKHIVSIEDVEIGLNNNFPDFLFATKIGLSMMAQVLIQDITNPFAVVLLDVPSSGKTLTINFFDDIKELTYASDKFSPASFVSHAANVSEDKLEQIDLLPRLRYKMLLVRDFGSILSQREEDLKQSLGILTRVLDGEGFESDSGMHGNRGYKGEYLFMLLGGSTPISPRVWKIMGNLGSRLFFLNLNSPNKSEDQLAGQLKDKSPKLKEKACRVVVSDFLRTLWTKYPEGVAWDKSKEDDECLKIIGRCAKFLAHLRGVVNITKKGGHFGEDDFTTPLVEKPDRLNQLFYNVARGHALIHGRTFVDKSDLKAVIELALDSADIIRSRLFQLLLSHGGELRTVDVEKGLNCSKPTALNHMKALGILGLCDVVSDGDYDGLGCPSHKIVLRGEFEWFLSEECQKIRKGEFS